MFFGFTFCFANQDLFDGEDRRNADRQTAAPTRDKSEAHDSCGSILAGLIEFGKRFVLVSESSVDGCDVGAVHVAMLRAGLELLQNLFRLGRFTGMRVTDRQLEIRTAKSGSRERLVAFHPILPAPLRDVNVRDRILVV